METPSSVAPTTSEGYFEVWQVMVPAVIAVLLTVADLVLIVVIFVRWRRRRGSGEEERGSGKGGA